MRNILKKRKKRTSRGWNALNCFQRLLADLKDLCCCGNTWMHKLLISFLPVENQKKPKNIHLQVRAILSRFNDARLQPTGFFLHSPRFHLSPVVVVWQAPPTGMRPHQSPSRPVFTSSLWLPCSRAGWSWNEWLKKQQQTSKQKPSEPCNRASGHMDGSSVASSHMKEQ